MKLMKVVERAITDEDYAKKLKAKAEAAYKAGVGTDEWTELMKEFAENPKELARLRRPGSHYGPSGWSGTTTGTRAATITTTTTTTEYASPKWLLDFAKKSKSKTKTKTKSKSKSKSKR